MTKPPYTKTYSLRTNPHTDTVQRDVYYTDGRVIRDLNSSVFVNNVTEYHSHSSVSTKPWPNGKPPIWTPQTRDHWSDLADSGSGQVVWTPGAQWPAVTRRVWKNQGGWGTVFTRYEDSFWSIAESEKPNKDALDNKIRLKLLDSWNAGTMMAEMSTTVGGIASRLGTLARAARALKRGNLTGAYAAFGYPQKKQLSSRRRRSLNREIVDRRYRQFASDWLELQYGWLPLLSDINGMIAYSKGRDLRTFIRASSSTSIERSRSYVTSSRIDGGLSRNSDTIEGTCRRAWTVEVKTNSDYLRRLNSVGLVNPLAVAWELVPFSFVVDWFLPVSDFLNATTATLGVTVVGTLYTERLSYQTRTVSSLVPASAADSASGYGERGHRYHKYQRSSPPFPTAKLPSFKNPLSTTHAANALALLTQSLKR